MVFLNLEIVQSGGDPGSPKQRPYLGKQATAQ
jgi:hypothetical protein